jgi:hypothetical protein
MDETNLDQFTFPLDENEELNALVLTNLLNTGVEEALSKLSPAELIQLEKNVQKLKRQKNTTGAGPGRPPKLGGSASGAGRKRPREESDGGLDELYGGDARSRPSGGQYMNLPASTPQTEFRDSIEWLHFTYSTKGHVQEYCIRVDIDELHLDEIPEDFKNDNCVYPRALVGREAYTGNRWDYETSVNDVAWKLTWRNPQILCGKRGLIQRAVDSYRNRTSENRSRRVMRQEKLSAQGIIPRPRRPDLEERSMGPKTLTIPYTDKDGAPQKVKIRVDVESVNLTEIDDEFRRNNCVYPAAFTDRDAYTAGDGRWEYEAACNELAWRLAWLNAAKIAGRRNLLQKAVDAYQTRIEASERARRSLRGRAGSMQAASYQAAMDQQAAAMAAAGYGMLMPEQFDPEAYYGKNDEFDQMVASTLQQALTEQGAGSLMMHHNPYAMHHADEDEEHHPQTMSTAELLGPHH